MYYLNIDGGGSKATFLITDEAGHTVAEDMTDGCSYPRVGIDGVPRMISGKLECLLDKAGLSTRDLKGAAFGLSCCGEDRKADEELERAVISATDLPCASAYNDAKLGWAGSLGLDADIRVAADTGAIAYGRDISGSSFRSNGRREDLSDEGSGYWLGMQVVSLFAKQTNGRLERSLLCQQMGEELGTSDADELVPLHRTEYMGNRKKIAALRKVLLKVAADGDFSAVILYGRGAEELAANIRVMASGLHLSKHSSVPVFYSNDVFLTGEFIMKSLKEASGSSWFDMRKPLLGPIQGGILLAMQQTAPDTVRLIRLVSMDGNRGNV